MKHILVSGATSFLGFRLVRQLAGRGYQVTAVVRPQRAKATILPQGVRVLAHTLHEYAKAFQSLESVDAFVHLAWDGTRGAGREDYERQEDCCEASLDAVKSILSRGCKRVISAGSQAQYGIWDGHISEDTPCNPVSAYGKSKLRFFEEGTKICIASGASFWEPRIFSLYGAGDVENTMVMSIARAMVQNNACELTECTQMWNFLHVSDAVEGILRLLELSDGAAGIYNLGNPESKPLCCFVQEMSLIIQSSSELRFGAIPFPKSGRVSMQPNVGKLLATGWRPRVSFQMGIEEIYRIIQEQSP